MLSHIWQIFACNPLNMEVLTAFSGAVSSFPQQLHGAWQMVDHYAFLPDDPSNTIQPMGADAQAMILYTSDGYMGAQFLTSGQKVSNATDAGFGDPLNLQSTEGTYMAYTGRFFLEHDGDTGAAFVLHRAEITNMPGLKGQTQKRRFEIKKEQDGEYLTLESVDPIGFFGENRIVNVKWKRLTEHLRQ